MKKHNIRHIALMAVTAIAAMTTTSCSDFLDKDPLSSGTEAIAFKNPTQFQQAADAFIGHLPGWSYSLWDGGTDITGVSSNGGGAAPESNSNWSGNYNNIRQYNILLAKAEAYPGDKTALQSSVGTAYFFRAYAYFNLLQHFGGVPIVDKVLSTSDADYLYGPRKSRYEVFAFILSDLRQAVSLLPQETAIADADKGRISKEGAEAFLGRVLLYEATWERYVSTIGYDLDGDGEKEGAGKAKPEGYPSVEEMLSESKSMSKAVMEEAEKGTYALWNECDSLSYYYLFNIDDKDGNISNYKNVGKKTNKEFIIYHKYDYDLRRAGLNIGHTVLTKQGVGMSAQFGESFLCRNGLPIRISRTGSMADAENNPEFEGYGEFASEYRNRDYRFIGSVFMPDRTVWGNRPEYATPHTENDGKPYPDPLFPKNSDKYDSSDPAYASVRGVFRPTLRNNTTFSGYDCRKYAPEGNRADKTESPDWPILRLAEVYLNYAEATCELQNGQISDEDLNLSINKLRDRAGVAHLTNALIQGVWDAGWWDYKTGHTMCHKMTMLDEIRRERACELFGEGFRMNDLKRWGVAQTHLTGQQLGRHVLNTAYTKYTANDNQYFGQPCYYPKKYPLKYGLYTGTGTDDPDYGRSVAVLASNLHWAVRDYLDAIPLQQIRLNTQLKQNPGW